MKVVVTQAALDDLFQIGRYVKVDNPARAETFVSEIYQRCHSLAEMPRAFPLLPKWEEQGIRRRPYGDYLIFYRISLDVVEILHILRGARDYEAILFPEG